MFYSQIVLSKKGPLGKVWLAAHDNHQKRLSRPQIFAFDISQTVHDIAHPVVPLALRLSGHLLLGVVRIYSRKVNYLVEDAHDASVKIDTAFTVAPIPHQPLKLSGRGRASAGGGGGGAGTDRMDMAHFGDLHHHGAFAAGGGFEIPTDLIPELEAWDEASTDDEEGNDHDNLKGRDVSPDGPSARKRRRTDDSALDDSLENVTRDTTTIDEESMRRSSTAAAGAGANSMMRSQLTTSAEMEDWGAFDPEDEDEDDEFNDDGKRRGKDSIVPEIETTRAADVSGSPDQLRRASELLKEDEPSDTEFPPPDQDNEDDNNMHPFSDDEDETPRGPRPSLAAALARDEEDALQFNESDSKGQFRLSSLGGAMDDSSRDPPLNLNDSDSRNASREAGVGGLDSSSDEEMGTHRKSAGGDGGGAQLADEEGAATPATKKRRAPTRKRKRRIAMDAGDTRMSADEIRRNLADASDLEVEQVHPATWLPGVEPDQQPKLLQRKSMEDRIREAMPLEMYLARPTCADRGDLAPALLNFWLRNNAMVLGNEFPYELQGTAAAAAAAKSTGTEADAEEMDEDDEEAEVARRSRAEGDDEGSAGRKRADDEEEEEPDFPQPDDDRELLSPGDDNAVVPFDDEDGVPPPPMDEDMEDPNAEGSAERRRLSSLSLGLVNDFVNEFEEEDEEEDDPRQAQGDQLVSSSSKWHKHTVKVFDMLRRNMPDDEPRQMSFNAICDPDGVTRRTACGVFFELLQLKTWDYIELDQDGFYGDMKISPGVRFSENPPAANRESMAGPSEGQAAAAAST